MATIIRVDDVLEQHLRAKQQELFEQNGLKVSLSSVLHHVYYESLKINEKQQKIKSDTDCKAKVSSSKKSVYDDTKRLAKRSSKGSSKLSENEQKALELKDQGLSNAEIAQEMGSKVQTVSGYVAKARKKKMIAEAELVE
jgi:DNA-binding NarL/FixJ family response regulator